MHEAPSRARRASFPSTPSFSLLAGRALALGLFAIAALAACSDDSPADSAGSAATANTSTSGGASGASNTPGSGGTSAGSSAGGATTGNSGSAGSGGASAGSAGSSAGSAGSSAGSDATGGSSGTGGNAGGAVDVFGIKQLYPSAASGAEWSSQHWDGDPYDITDRIDDNDPLGISGLRGDGTLQVTGDGELVMGGSEPRIYIYPTPSGPWQNLEITAYYQRISDEGTAYAGLVIGTRSGEEGHTTDGACDAHTYYARIRNDGEFDFEKELEHPASSTQSRIDAEIAWPPSGEVPLNTWIGFKFVIYNPAGTGTVKLEAYRDLSAGQNGGDWQLVNETVDDGGWFVESTCPEHAPNGDGESALVVTAGGTTLIRNTNVTEARYRWVSVREIAAP